MPLLISRSARSPAVASLCSTIAAIRAVLVGRCGRSRAGRSTTAVSTVAAARRALVRSTSALERRRTQQRHVAGQQHAPCRVRPVEERLGLQQRVPGAELRLLQCKVEGPAVARAPPAPARPDDRR